MCPTLHGNCDYFHWIKSLTTSSKIIPCVCEHITLGRFNLLCFWSTILSFCSNVCYSTNKSPKFRSQVPKIWLWTCRTDHEAREIRVLQNCIYFFGAQGEKNAPWNTSIENLLQFHSDFLTSCGPLYQLQDFLRNILLFNKSFAKKNSQTAFSSLLLFTIVLKLEEKAERKK